MINMIFALTYQQQLRQTQPEMFASLEKSIAALIASCGGKEHPEHKYFAASFDNHAIAFWLDMLIFIEGIDAHLKDTSDELYGHVCVITPETIDLEEYAGMLHELSFHKNYTGIWIAKEIAVHLHPYFEMDETPSMSFITKKHFDVIEVKREKNQHPEQKNAAGVYPLRKNIIDVLEQQKNNPFVLLIGADYIGIKDGLYSFCKKWNSSKQSGDIPQGGTPPLVFRFGSGGKGLSCIVDAFESEIKHFFETNDVSPETIHRLEDRKTLIARERIRDEFPSTIIEHAGAFLSLLTKTYLEITEKQNSSAFIIIENMDEIDDIAPALMMQKINDLQKRKGISIFCTAREEKNLETWKNLNFKVILFSLPESKTAESITRINLFKDMKELWEIVYMCFLMRSYFPGFAFFSLFNEEGKNPAVTARAFEILHTQGLITSLQDPLPIIENFAEEAEKILGEERIGGIKTMVRNRLLAWVSQEKLLPCFNLLKAVIELGGDCGDDLILDAIYRDTIDGVFSGLKDSIASGQFHMIAGNTRIISLTYFFYTFAALVHENEESIRKTFLSTPPEVIPSSRYISYIESNLASYYLSIHRLEEAAASVKKAMLAAQNVQKRGGARAFRLHALVNAMQGNVADSLDYFQFAADHAEHSKDWEELVMISYFSSIVHFLFGNISKAERLADHAESLAFKCGMNSWAEKSRFFKGRILFEQGKYLDAYDIFESIIPANDNEDTLQAWKYRAKVFSGDSLPNNIKNDGDGAVFLIETAYINQEYEKSVELADQLLQNLPENNFNFIEQIDWKSGFSQIEFLLFPQKNLWYRLASTYQALSLSQQEMHTDAANIVSMMQQITRDDKFSNIDTNDAFYCFANYQVLQNTNASEIDLNTAVSMAFKRLQRRASRIDNIETKRAFLSQNRWNNVLGEAAKHYKLI